MHPMSRYTPSAANALAQTARLTLERSMADSSLHFGSSLLADGDEAEPEEDEDGDRDRRDEPQPERPPTVHEQQDESDDKLEPDGAKQRRQVVVANGPVQHGVINGRD